MQLFFSSLSALVLLHLALRVSAHGFPTSVTIDGKQYNGANGADASSDSPMRKVSTGDPVTDVTSNNIICGQNAATASTDATAKPGSKLQFYWKGEAGTNWFHTTGPIMTYMAKCEGDCTSFTPSSSTQWFKIDEQGEKNGATDSWAQANLLSGAPANVTVPSTLAAGKYLVRHEIIALQNSQSEGGAEFYPSCLQLTVSGNESGTPNTTVQFPGAYTQSDKGILGNFYNPGTVYVFPGGPVAQLTGGGSSSGSDSSSSSASPSSSSSSSSASASPSSSVPSSTESASGSSSASPTASPSSSPSETASSSSGTEEPASSPSSAASPSTAAPSATSSSSGRCSSSKKRRLSRRAAPEAVESEGNASTENFRVVRLRHNRRFSASRH
ncbi:glycosyl hydrolase family 61-domain-containing protein [Phellopilus nigrolimitatus]|nr:glycosyl hydrolase family 61-domain-containing protein [Phellopilus nigrolimitatus]